ncbi:putative transferase CAF17 homolog, mitochondrial [Pollicipes pollicipes]|uniref:putative transferase CAF17 homolog, mitochondrial n=1 Tax=Pollicipes pollicipes TaxID=41117 RepID=UPI001884DAD0|nr:putative transferase CAF17 homolog, mitochondrial [Pollicipes pollicipes]
MMMSGVASGLVRRLVPACGARACSSSPPSHWTHHLKSRGVLRVRGPDCASFLQGLVTNDMRHFDDGARAIYAMMLNTKGRVLFDLIVYRHDDDRGFLLEADRTLVSSLQSLLKIYRVRRKIDVDDVSEQTAVVAVREAGGLDGDAPAGSPDCTEHGRGADEIPHAACTPLEYSADFLHGVSFHKGCYVGQELTARTHHTGVVRKRVMPLRFARAPGDAALGGALLGPAGGRPLGKVLAVSGEHGLGLLRVAESLASAQMTLEGADGEVTTHRPSWWPLEAARDPKAKAA